MNATTPNPEHAALISELRERAQAGERLSQMLRYVAQERGIHQQIVWMELFAEAFQTNLGSLTALSAWWFEGESELTDDDLDDYVHYVVEEYLAERH